MLDRLQYWRAYFRGVNESACLICYGLIDRISGMGMIYTSTDFDALFAALAEYPANYMIGQARDELMQIKKELENG